jgi:hypothetical protein
MEGRSLMDRFYAVLDWLWHPDNLTAISTFVIAAFTAVLVRVGYCQARLIRKSIDLTRAEYVSTHRPRVILRDVNWEGHSDIHYTLVSQSVFRRIRDDKSRSFVRLANERDQEYAD